MKAGLRAAGLSFGLWVALAGPVRAEGASTQTSSAAAPASDEAAREAALFGESPVAEPAAPAATADRESALFGEPAPPPTAGREAALFGATETSSRAPSVDPTSEAGSIGASDRLLDAMRDRDDLLDIGGVFWLWGQVGGADGQPFEQSTIASPSFVDLYLDARPSDRVRAYARARTNFDPTVDETPSALTGVAAQKVRVRLDQLWLKLDIARTVFVTAGKQRIRWGAGRIWNPTDFLNPSRLDALNFLDVRLGVTLLKLHLPLESLGWNFYAIAEFDDATAIERVGGALRAEVLLGTAEVSLSAALRKDRPVRLGADASLPIGDFDLRVEAALLHDVRRPFYDASADAGFLEDIDLIDTIEEVEAVVGLLTAAPIDRSDDWIPQLVVGLDYVVAYSDEDSLRLSLEYFYNDLGTDEPGTYLVSLLNGGFEGLYAGRHYAALAAYLVAPGDWNDSVFALVGLANLSDRTGLVRLNYTVQVLTFLRLNLFGQLFLGAKGGEFRLGLRVPPVDPALLDVLMRVDPELAAGLPAGLENGFDFSPPRWQLGGTLVVDL